MKSKSFYGAIDLAGKTAALALADADGHLLCDLQCPMRGRDSAKLALWITEALANAGVELDAVRFWTVGSGPGSFTGMRLAASLVVGWQFGKPEIRSRNVPTAVAVAAQLGDLPDGATAGLLFDGRNSEILAFEVRRQGEQFVPTGFTAVWNADAAAEGLARFDRLGALRDDFDAVARLAGTKWQEKIQVGEQLSARPLLQAAAPDYQNDLTRLVYIRPAVF